ncbi:MAG: putative damage-inducible protein DinB [Chlamydiales bacterium]|jgi:uncharacterized damage-inducible protein DinB
MPMDLARVLANYLGEYVGRLERALEVLPEQDTWWAPHASALSVGNILVHLTGNVRQWILSGLGQIPDRRERATEFAQKAGPGAPELLAQLKLAVDAARTTIGDLGAADLQAAFQIQGKRVTGWEAVLHVVEHFSWHTGQVVWIAKQRAGAEHGLAFYDDAQINAARNREPDD